MRVLISCIPFAYSSELASCFCLDEGHLASASSLAHPPGYYHVFSVYVLRGFVQHLGHCLWANFIEGKKKLPGRNPQVKIVTRTLPLALSIKKASLLKWVTYDLKLSSSHYVMLSMVAEDLLCLCPLMKCMTKCPLNSLKMETVFGVSLLNHTLAGPFKVVRKALHIISSITPCKYMRVLNDSKWSSGSSEPSYAFTCGIRNLARRGKEVTYVVKGESVHYTSSSKLVDTYPLRAFIIMSIFSFIICISYTMRNAPTSSSEG